MDMKRIYYEIINLANNGTEELHNLFAKSIPYSPANEELAKQEAYNGDYTIEDDGRPEPKAEATTDEVLNVLLGVGI